MGPRMTFASAVFNRKIASQNNTIVEKVCSIRVK